MTGGLAMTTRNSAPRVSIGLPVYNAERYLADAFEALLAQDYRDLEIIVCDNRSTDGTWAICRSFAERDGRVCLHRNEENRGAAYNYNRVVELARGELFRWAAYDDLCAPTLVSRCVEALDASAGRAVLTYPKTILIDGAGAEVGPYSDRLDLRDALAWWRVGRVAGRFNLCNALFGVLPIARLRRTGLIRPYPSSDVTLLAELAALGEFHEVPEALFYRRIHEQSSRQGTDSERGSLAGVAAWFDPRRTGPVRAPRLQLTARTATALLGNGSHLPAVTRVACATSFATSFGIRRVRVLAGQARRNLRRSRRADGADRA
ncbi:glycosyltransferase family 2 protein [Plantactinospora sp. GCM10030261]|uniref:glycosyltransferase family 2 protein n=1 Tax=Plantactinospora sp. GCM10030261 TaxID=3273420 RepID=UPI0036065D2E